MPLADFSKRAAGYGGMIAASLFPMSNFVLPSNLKSVVVFPPLGGINSLLEPVATLLIGASAIFALHQRRQRSPSSRFRRGYYFALAGATIYAVLMLAFVVRIDFLAIYLTPPTPTSSVFGCGRGLSQDVA